MYRNSKKVNLERLKRDSITDNVTKLIDLNRAQLRAGKGSHGGSLGSYINKRYMRFKSSLSSYVAGLPLPDLFVKGGFYRGLRMFIQGKEVIFEKSASDNTPYWWLKVYKGIFGLNSKSMNKAKTIVSNDYVKEVAKALRK